MPKKASLLFLLVSFIFLGCRLEYDGDTKIIFEGKITDINQNPIENIYIGIHLANSYDQENINYTTTDENGNYRMVFPKPVNATEVALTVNTNDYTYNTRVNSELSKGIIGNIQIDSINGYKVVFDNYRLFQLNNSTTLSININNPNNINVKLINFKGEVDNNYYYYNLPLNDNLNDYNYTTDYSNITVSKNQVITLTYQTKNEYGDPVFNDAEIIIEDSPVNYTLNL